MSVPISNCLLSKAVRDEAHYQRLLSAMRYNRECGHFTQVGCQHDPPCPEPTEEEYNKLEERLKKDLENRNLAESSPEADDSEEVTKITRGEAILTQILIRHWRVSKAATESIGRLFGIPAEGLDIDAEIEEFQKRLDSLIGPVE